MARHIIEYVRLYKFNIPGRTGSRQQLFIELGSSKRSGWGECVLSYNRQAADLFSVASCFEYIRGKTVTEAIAAVRCMFGVWRHALTEATEFALVDLGGKLSGRPAAELLVLDYNRPVPGVFSIASRNPAVVKERTAYAVAQHRDRCIRIKLYGDLDTDKALISAVRSAAPAKRTFLIGDAGKCYGNPLKFEVEKLGIQLLMLHSAGMDACMDPSEMRTENWGELNSFVTPLNLVCGYPMRPARLAERIIYPKMAGMYHIRPGFMGSVYDTVQLGEKIKRMGGMLMIGDAHLIGPGCAAWQQLAIGMGADLVEAVEKDKESEMYRRALRYSGVECKNGVYTRCGSNGGFGTELDRRVLERYATQILEL